MESEKLAEILRLHGMWLRGEDGGVRADLRFANLRSANLSSANLRSADLRFANLSSANLRSADLSFADLSSANLRSADLSFADLRFADLSFADLSSADLYETAIMRLHCDYECTIYPGHVMAYGCEKHTLDVWERDVEMITRRHIVPEEKIAEKIRELRAIFALARTIPQPKREKVTS